MSSLRKDAKRYVTELVEVTTGSDNEIVLICNVSLFGVFTDLRVQVVFILN